jgi:hypothetical protein
MPFAVLSDSSSDDETPIVMTQPKKIFRKKITKKITAPVPLPRNRPIRALTDIQRTNQVLRLMEYYLPLELKLKVISYVQNIMEWNGLVQVMDDNSWHARGYSRNDVYDRYYIMASSINNVFTYSDIKVGMEFKLPPVKGPMYNSEKMAMNPFNKTPMAASDRKLQDIVDAQMTKDVAAFSELGKDVMSCMKQTTFKVIKVGTAGKMEKVDTYFTKKGVKQCETKTIVPLKKGTGKRANPNGLGGNYDKDPVQMKHGALDITDTFHPIGGRYAAPKNTLFYHLQRDKKTVSQRRVFTGIRMNPEDCDYELHTTGVCRWDFDKDTNADTMIRIGCGNGDHGYTVDKGQGWNEIEN